LGRAAGPVAGPAPALGLGRAGVGRASGRWRWPAGRAALALDPWRRERRSFAGALGLSPWRPAFASGPLGPADSARASARPGQAADRPSATVAARWTAPAPGLDRGRLAPLASR